MRIFYCWSQIRVMPNTEPVNVCWFRSENRDKPIYPYNEIISDYGALDARRRELMQQYVDEHFTESESAVLRQYLQQVYGWTIRLQETALPAVYYEDPEAGRGTTTFRQFMDARYRNAPTVGFNQLSGEPGYALPFRVWGYYNPLTVRKTDGS